MLVDELFIPHREGTVRVRLDRRLTVVAGLPSDARARFADRLVGALACVGPACVQVRDDQGCTALLSANGARTADGTRVEGPVPAMASSAEALARMMVVRAEDLGLDPGRPGSTVQAEWTAMSIDHRQLVHELAAAEAGAEERRRLERELGEAPLAAHGRTAAGERSTRDAVAALGPRIDELLRRRAAADQLLVETAGAVRAATSAADDPGAATGPLPHGGGTLVSGLRAAVSALRRVESRRRASEEEGSDVDGAEAERAAAAARAVLRRAADDLDGAREAARAEIAACDRELAEMADRAGIKVGPDGPGAALTEVLARGERAPVDEDDEPTSAAVRLLRRRREVLRARIAELPTDEDVAAARRRMEVASAHLARLEATEPALTAEVATRVRTVLLGRAASLRPQGTCSGAPLVLDDPLVRLVPDARCDLLDVVLRVAQRVQVVLLTDDGAATAWARHRADQGELRLIDVGASGS